MTRLIDADALSDIDVNKYIKLPYATSSELKFALNRNKHLMLMYHGEIKNIKALMDKGNCLYVSDGVMLPVQIWPDGSSKDGRNIYIFELQEDGMNLRTKP